MINKILYLSFYCIVSHSYFCLFYICFLVFLNWILSNIIFSYHLIFIVISIHFSLLMEFRLSSTLTCYKLILFNIIFFILILFFSFFISIYFPIFMELDLFLLRRFINGFFSFFFRDLFPLGRIRI